VAGLPRNGCDRASFNLLVSLPDGRELCISKELNEEAANTIFARRQKILEVIARSVRFIIKADISG
jgi:hypothetical protein